MGKLFKQFIADRIEETICEEMMEVTLKNILKSLLTTVFLPSKPPYPDMMLES